MLDREPAKVGASPRARHVAVVTRRIAQEDAEDPRLDRLDTLSRQVVNAALLLQDALAGTAVERVAVVVGSAAATMAINERFELGRLRGRPPPRLFPPTSPNVCAAACSLALGLKGPCLATAAGPKAALEALLIGHDLISAGDADAALVLAAEEASPFVRMLWSQAGYPPLEVGAGGVVLRPARLEHSADNGAMIERKALVDVLAAKNFTKTGFSLLFDFLDRAL